MRKLLSGLFWGTLIWFVLTFFLGAIWGMSHIPTVLESSIYANLILLPPSLVLGVVLVANRRTQFMKRSLTSIILGLVLWFLAGALLAVIIPLTSVPREAAVRYLHLLNPVLASITVAASCLFIFRIYPRMKARSVHPGR